MLSSIKLILISLLGSTLACPALTYTTLFPSTENPISEGSSWLNGAVDGLDWNNVRTTTGKAFGTQVSGDIGFDDSTAILKGSWGPDQTVTGTVFVLSEGSGSEEVELRLRSSLSSHSCTGYECLFSCRSGTPYVQIVRWLGPIGPEHTGFEYITKDTTHFVVNGDRVKATIVGSLISVYINDVLIITGTDSVYSTGNPGMGFYLDNTVTPSNYGFTQFSATDGINPVTSFSPAPFGR